MHPDSRPFALSPFAFSGDFLSEGGIEVSRALFLSSLLFFGGGGMDLSKVGEKILSSVRSARSLGLLPSTSDRPEVPARAAAAAAVARILSGLPPHQRHNLSSSSEELSSIYGSGLQGQVVEELEEEFYEEEFDPVRHVLEHIPTEENELAYFEEKAALRLTQLDMISERLSRTVMEHHEEMVKGMHLVRELEKDLKVASVICMNGRRHLISSQNEVSRDLVVNKSSKKKQALLDMLPFLTELHHALDMQIALETLVEQGNFFKAFQILSEYLQLLDSMSDLSAIQEMSRAVEAWLSKTLQKLDSLLLRVCQDFDVEGFVTVLDAYALIGDVAGLAEKIQSFFMQEVLSETHAILKGIVQEDVETPNVQSTSSRLTYSDLCYRIPESKFRHCLLETLAVLFKLMGSYYAIMSFQPENEVSVCRTTLVKQKQVDSVTINSYSDAGGSSVSESFNRVPILASGEDSSATTASSSDVIITNGSANIDSSDSVIVTRDGGSAASSSESPWFQLRKDAAGFVSHTLQRGRKNLWQLITSRVSVLLSSAAACSPSIHQFLINYEDLNIFILAGEAFCGTEAVEFREKVKTVCENYFTAFHRQNVYALKMVIEKENWLAMPPDTIQEISFSGLVGDGAALIAPADSSPDSRILHSSKSLGPTEKGSKKSGFSHWLQTRNPFSLKLSDTLQEQQHDSFVSHDSVVSGDHGKINNENLNNNTTSHLKVDANHDNGNASIPEDENEDLHADFIDEDSQLPSRISKPKSLNFFSSHSNAEMWAQTGSSLCVLRLMDKYARLMQKLEIANVEFFKGICQLFGIFFYFVFESFCHPSSNSSGKGSTDSFSYPLKSALARIRQDYEQWIKPQTVISLPTSMNSSLSHSDVTPTSPPSTNFGHSFGTSCGLKERCAAADCVSLVAHLLHKSKAHLQLMLLQNNTAIVEDFYEHLVDAVPELTEQIHRTTARLLLHISGYVDRIASAKWDVRELGLEHNGYVDLLLGEFKHYKTRLTHGGIHKKAQDLLLEYGLESVAETLVEGLSRVKKCTDEGRALMSLDLQVLINGLRHFASIDVKPKFQVVDTFIKAYYLPETEYVHWARAHPEYSKGQIVGLINLVATMKGWKRKTKLEILEKIE